ncbi:MAG TPA: PP2C family serine/threonine-protein phosphatase [Acidimicrobiales bacterium]|nr:PP2C family serine/threonine-protein phosphatase [Acidimicrobiales bacterium]
MTRWRYAAATDTGQVRDLNEDMVFVDSSLAVVADGMGGHAAGEVAATLAIEAVERGFHEDSTVEGLNRAIEEANRVVIADARANPERTGMGTTVIAVGLTHDSSGTVFPTLFNVGDSRAYQLRDGALRQLSEDHSVAEEWVRMGRLTPDEALTHPRRHQLTRALGIEGELDIDVQTISARPGDRLLLCSDGLSNELPAEALARLGSADEPLEDVVGHLVQAAIDAGGRDNISAIIVEFDEVSLAPVPIKKTMSARPLVVAGTSGTTSRRRRRLFTWRVGITFILLVAIAAAFIAVMHWFAYSGYYIGDDAGTIAIYRGQPNGVLWYKPEVVSLTSYPSTHLRPVDYSALEATISEPSFSAAVNYVNYLHEEWKTAGSHPVHTLPTTTLPGHSTTTVKGRTTTTVKHRTTTTLKGTG